MRGPYSTPITPLTGSLFHADLQLIPDICWCSNRTPVFPPETQAVLTNSGKYAHYGPGPSSRAVRLGSLSDCITAALTGRAAPRQPDWLA